MLADLYLKDKVHAKAAKILETGFCQAPHPPLAERLRQAWKSNDGQYVSRLVKLLDKVEKGQQRLAYYLVAEQARAAGMDGEAERLLSDVNDLTDTARSNDNVGIANDDKKPGDTRPLWQCDSCKGLAEDWQPFCPTCDGFATLVWQRPTGATPLSRRI